MRHLFIKRGAKGFDFSFATDDSCNKNYQKLDEYNGSESDLQVISNGKFFIFYDTVYRVEQAFLKMLFEDELSKVDSISLEDVRSDLVFKVKKTLTDCKRMFYQDKGPEKRERCSGNIIIANGENAFLIRANFIVCDLELYLDDNDTNALALDEILEHNSPLEIMEFLFARAEKVHAFCNYPIVYGNTTKQKVTLISSDKETKECELEEFVCHW